MRDRPSVTATKAALRRTVFTVDVVLLTPRGRQLGIMLARIDDARARERWCVPYAAPEGDEMLDATARRVVREITDVEPAWIEQIGAFGDGRRHPAEYDLSVAFVSVVAQGTMPSESGTCAWFPVHEIPPLAPRQRVIVDAALDAIRARLDQSPIAFRLLPPTFTLSELQQTYELLLSRRLHKASFRRALQAAWLVEPTDEWRSEGRGRPAQLFRFAPRKRRSQRRGVRFDLLAE
jgi:8-oxo-dGTP diphosphatase